ncbi:uncharacterized protein LOC110841002 isoform X2 [Zootermopsis nevadensis]|nr:uncharacterized protein LOC110841002 isoform X2 [Zootermopsis nevadensis]
MKDIEHRIEQVRTEEELIGMNRAFIALMFMKSQYSLLTAVTWRYVCNPYSGSGQLACFYAGTLLDEFLSFLRLAHDSPEDLEVNLRYVYKVNDVTKLMVPCRTFMNHFERITEKKLNNDYSISGAKFIDLFDCLLSDDDRTTPYEQAITVNGTECHIKAHYRMPNTWFCFQHSYDHQSKMWNDEQRRMYLCMRQLITKRDHLFLEKILCERKVLFRKRGSRFTSKCRVPSVYHQSVEYAGYLFYFETVDRSAHDFDFNGVKSLAGDTPKMDLNIDIELHSPLELAPINYLKRSEVQSLDFRCNHVGMPPDPLLVNHEPKFLLKMTINCPGSTTNDLPSTFYHIISSTKDD